ncbi:MAG: hypothetical protein ABH882_02220 [Candidatus Omnitrophota bacterium]|nr:hypothetical protein [Candidatus Omnitrophota bacterium]
MAQTSWQKFITHCKNGGLFYAFYRGFKYLAWRNQCARKKIDWRQFSRQ